MIKIKYIHDDEDDSIIVLSAYRMYDSSAETQFVYDIIDYLYPDHITLNLDEDDIIDIIKYQEYKLSCNIDDHNYGLRKGSS